MKTRNKARAPIWEAEAWLQENYEEQNGLPNFFREGSYSFAMKQTAEEDYITVVNAVANKHENDAFHKWAVNMKTNEYRAIYLTTTLDYWRYVADKEQSNISRDEAAGISLTNSTTRSERVVKRPKNNYLSTDTFFVNGYRESFGTIIGRFGRSYVSYDNKSSYFKTLAMNNIMDLSDDSEGSHLAQVNPDAQNLVKQMLYKSSVTEQAAESDCEVFENIIQKFKLEEDEDKFLAKVIKEADDANLEKVIKRIYLQILETMLYDKYLFTEEGCSEADYIVKLYGPIMENLFRGSGCKLIWGDTKSPFCKKESNESRLDLRIVSSQARTAPDLCVSEYAKKAAPWKYYYDKTKTVVASFILLKQHIKHANLDFQEAKAFVLPFVICEGLEADIYTIRLVSQDWCVVEKIKDMDLPCCVTNVKDGNIAEYLNHLKRFKQMCMDSKNQSAKNRRKSRGMHKISNKQPSIDNFLRKNLWVDPYDGESTDTDDDE